MFMVASGVNVNVKSFGRVGYRHHKCKWQALSALLEATGDCARFIGVSQVTVHHVRGLFLSSMSVAMVAQEQHLLVKVAQPPTDLSNYHH